MTEKLFLKRKGNFEIDFVNMNKAGVYAIIDNDYNIYIGSTMNLYQRYNGHMKNSWNTPTKKMLENNSRFVLLYLYDNNDYDLMRMCEYHVIDNYKDNTKYNVINKRTHDSW